MKTSLLSTLPLAVIFMALGIYAIIRREIGIPIKGIDHISPWIAIIFGGLFLLAFLFKKKIITKWEEELPEQD